MKKIVFLALSMLALVASAACTQDYTWPPGAGGAGGSSACEPVTAIEDVPPVLAAYIACLEAADGPEIVADLIEPARSASADPDVERARATHAIDNLIRGHLVPFVAAAGVPASDWLDSLPAGELSPEQAYQAAREAYVLIRALRDALPLADASWVAAYDAIAAERHAAVHAVTGRPVEWFGSATAHDATWDAALVAGFDAAQEAWDAAPKGTPAEVESAVGAAVQALLVANAATFATIRENAVTEAQTLTTME
jgi:hypothetical protein